MIENTNSNQFTREQPQATTCQQKGMNATQSCDEAAILSKLDPNRQILKCTGCGHQENDQTPIIRHVYKDCHIHKQVFFSQIDPKLGHEERFQRAREIIRGETQKYYTRIAPQKRKADNLNENQQKQKETEKNEEKEVGIPISNPLIEMLKTTNHIRSESNPAPISARKTGQEKVAAQILHSETQESPATIKKTRKLNTQDFSDLVDDTTLLIFKNLDDDYLLKDLDVKKRESLIAMKDYIRSLIKESNENRKKVKEEERNLSVASLIGQVPKELVFLMKHLITSDSHERKRINPLIAMAKRANNGLNDQEKGVFQSHVSSVRKRLCSAIVLSNQVVNAGCCKEFTSLKLIASLAFREQNMTNKGTGALSGIGATHSCNNILDLAQKKAEVIKMDKEKAKNLENLVKKSFGVVVSDNNYFQKSRHTMNKDDDDGVMTISNGMFILKNPSPKLLELEKSHKVFIPIPKQEASQFANEIFSLSEKEKSAWWSCMNEHFQTVKQKRSLFHYKSQAPAKPIVEIDYHMMTSNILSDAGMVNNISNIQFIDKYLQSKFGVNLQSEPRVHVCDQKGNAAIRKAMYGIRPKATPKDSEETTKLLKTKIYSHPFTGDWHLVVNALDACCVFYENFLYEFGVVLNCSTDWSQVTSGNGKFQVAKNTNTAVFHFCMKKLIEFFEKEQKKEIKNAQELYELCETKFVKNATTLQEQENSKSLGLSFLQSKISIEISKILKQNELDDLSANFIKEFCIHAKLEASGHKKQMIDRILEEQKKNTTLPYTFHQFKINNLMNFKVLNLKQVKDYCKICNIQSSGDKDVLIARLDNFMKTFNTKVDVNYQFLFNCYVFIKNFGCIPLFLYRAIRTNDFHLRMAVLKKSVRLFQCGKPLYLNLVCEHLFDFNYLYPKFFRKMMKEIWVVKTDHTKGFLALDEYMECKHNKYLKKVVKVAEKDHITKVSSLANVTKEMVQIFHLLLGIRKSNFSRKSEDMDWSMVERFEGMDQLPGGLHVSSLLEMVKEPETSDYVALMDEVLKKTHPDCFQK